MGVIGSEKAPKKKAHKQTFRGIVSGFGGILLMCFYSPDEGDTQKSK